MKIIFSGLKLYALSFVLSIGLCLLVTPRDSWGAFGASPEGQHLLVLHLLKTISGAGQGAFVIAFCLGVIGIFLDQLDGTRLRNTEKASVGLADQPGVGGAIQTNSN